jgi:hypothetical protein
MYITCIERDQGPLGHFLCMYCREYHSSCFLREAADVGCKELFTMLDIGK